MNHALNNILCSADEAQLMRLLLQLIKAKKTIEIGKNGKVIIMAALLKWHVW